MAIERIYHPELPTSRPIGLPPPPPPAGNKKTIKIELIIKKEN